MPKRKKLSLLGFKPDWRYRSAISEVTKLEDSADGVVERYLKAKGEGFRSDKELYCVVDMSYEDRGLVEALYLGGASFSEISDITQTDTSIIKLIIDLYFDVADIRKSPLLRTQVAQKEKNRVVKSYKVFAAKYGWKEFLKQFLRRDELGSEPISVNDAFSQLFNELNKKISELGMFETGTSNSRELRSWMKLLLELTKEMRENECGSESEKNIDVKLIMEAMNNHSSKSPGKESFEFIPKLVFKKEEDTDES